MASRILPAMLTLASALLAVTLASVATDAFAAPLPSIVFITLDTTRADHLGLYGYPRGTSPRLDAFSQESLVFDRMVAPMATTLPSHISLFTATHPDEHGVLANVKHGGRRFASSAELTPFASYLQDIGLRTGAFVSAAPLKGGTGIERGFEIFDEPALEQRPAAETTARALRWLRGLETGEPYFLWVHYFDPHSPRDPPEEFANHVWQEELGAHRIDRAIPEQLPKPNGGSLDVGDLADRYDAEILYMDRSIGELLDAVQAADSWNRTVVVIAGDHGEGLGQHGALGHGHLWREQLRSPLMIRLPGEESRRSGDVLSMVDIVPTLLGRLELPDESRFLHQASGQDILAPTAIHRPALSRTSLKHQKRGEPVAYSLTGPRWKFIADDTGDTQLFDLDRDPHERRPVQAEHPETVRRLDEELDALVTALRARGHAIRAAEDPPLDPEIVDQLEALGYVGDSATEPAR